MRTLFFLPALLVACDVPTGPASDAYHGDILPTEQKIKINLPMGEDGASAKSATSGTRTDWAPYYEVTRNVTENVNGLVTYILGTVAYVSTLEPQWSDTEENQAVWGPYSDSGLDPVETGLWVQQGDDGSYTWAIFQVPNGGDVENDAVVIIAGEVDAGATSEAASGYFVADFTTASSMDPAVNLTGTFAVEYVYDAEGVAGSAAFDDYGSAGGGERFDAVYAYEEDYEGAGSMDLAWLEDIGGGSSEELMTMRSRWQADGQGRSDATASEGDFAEGDYVVAANCWGTDFETAYWYDSVGFYDQVGDGTACVYTDASYPTEASFSILD